MLGLRRRNGGTGIDKKKEGFSSLIMYNAFFFALFFFPLMDMWADAHTPGLGCNRTGMDISLRSHTMS